MLDEPMLQSHKDALVQHALIFSGIPLGLVMMIWLSFPTIPLHDLNLKGRVNTGMLCADRVQQVETGSKKSKQGWESRNRVKKVLKTSDLSVVGRASSGHQKRRGEQKIGFSMKVCRHDETGHASQRTNHMNRVLADAHVLANRGQMLAKLHDTQTKNDWQATQT